MQARRAALTVLVAAVAAGVPAAPAYAAGVERLRATVTRTQHGIPNIEARSWRGAAYGYGYAFAEDNICTIADSYVTVRAQRSRFFGPDAEYEFVGNGDIVTNINSDFFFQRIIDDRVVEKLIRQKPPAGPRKAIREGVRGYVAGYNRYLEETGRDGIPDPTCRGEPWVRKIKPIDAYRRFYQLALLASQGVAIDGVAEAQPPTPPLSSSSRRHAGAPVTDREREMLAELRERLPLGHAGSNAYGLGRAATRNRSGAVLGNPHFPWNGSERFYQSHITIPGKANVSGASLFGVPLVLIGHTENLAWSHTVSTAFRFTPFEVKLVPGSPTTYVVDGQPREMEVDTVTVKARAPDGSLEERTRKLYSTEYGPMFNSILGLPLFPWTPVVGYAMGDVNAGNFRYLNHFFDTNRAQSTRELLKILERYQGIPWVNTIAADSDGRALYADIGAIPNVPDEKVAACNVPGLGTAAFQLLGLPVLDGARASCAWDDDPDAAAPGILGPKALPHLFRRDYVTNSNDSYWLSNPEEPLEGYDRIIGNERTQRSLRTRLGLRIVQERLAGADGQRGKGFTRAQVQRAVFNNRQYAGELWRDQLVEMCRENPVLIGTSGPVETGDACDALAEWDLRDNLDSRGAVLFRRFASRALGSPLSPAPNPISPFATPFDPSDPVNTPNGLNTGSPFVRAALADAINDLRRSNIPLAAPLGDWQYEMRGNDRVPIHGGPGGVGVFNAINVRWVTGEGYPDVDHGSSFVMVTSFGRGCPDDRTILTYSQSANPKSRWHADQTRMYSRKKWVDPPFCPGELDDAKAVDVVKLGPKGPR